MHRSIQTLALIVLAAAAVSPAFAGTSPKLVVENKVIDLGEVPQGAVKEVRFELKNEGDAALQIRSVRPTCGCTVAEFDKEIGPGATGAVKATLDTAGFKGAISKSILVMSNDPINSTMTLVIKAVVQPYIDVLPRALVRFNTLQKEKAEQKIVLAATERSGDFKITGVSTDNDALEVSYRLLAENERVEGNPAPQYEVLIRLADDAPVGPISSVVTVKTTAAKADEVEIKVFGVVRALLRVTPPELQFGAVKSSQTPSRNLVIVNNRPDSTLEITGASIDDAAFKAEVVPVEAGKRFQVTVSIKPDAEAGTKNATLTLKTTDPDFPELKVPVRASLR